MKDGEAEGKVKWDQVWRQMHIPLMTLIESLLQDLQMKKTTWQILSKHLPTRTESYETRELVLALLCCGAGM